MVVGLIRASQVESRRVKMEITNQVMQKLVESAVKELLNKSVRHRIDKIVRELFLSLFGRSQIRKGGSPLHELPGFRECMHDAMAEAMVRWLGEVLGDELGVPLIDHVMGQVDFL